MARPRCAICSPRSRRAGTIPLDRFIFALGIRHVGETNARLLARHFDDIRGAARRLRARRRRETSEAREEIGNIEGIGGVVAEAVADFFAEPHNETALDALLKEVTPHADGARSKATRPSPARRWSSPARSSA